MAWVRRAGGEHGDVAQGKSEEGVKLLWLNCLPQVLSPVPQKSSGKHYKKCFKPKACFYCLLVLLCWRWEMCAEACILKRSFSIVMGLDWGGNRGKMMVMWTVTVERRHQWKALGLIDVCTQCIPFSKRKKCPFWKSPFVMQTEKFATDDSRDATEWHDCTFQICPLIFKTQKLRATTVT